MSFLCSIPIVGSLLATCLPPLPLATGYVEGEYILIAPVEIAQIEHVAVTRGDVVTKGQALVFLETRDAEIAIAQADALLSQAQSNLANISQGRRPQEIAVIEASLASARAQSTETRRELSRQLDLLARGLTPQAKYDQADTQNKIAIARVVELEANLRVATLPARLDEIKAAKARVAQALAQQDQAQWRLSKRTLLAIGPGVVTDVIRNAGEVASPQAPVLAMLPDGAVKLRLYIPEISIAQVHVGTILTVGCDGCSDGLLAKVSYIAEGPEFTPPIIFSLENRQKLVFLVEARIDPDGESLKPGQIVNVDISGSSE